MNLQDITLQSLDDTLVARNEHGHLTAPILCLDREPVLEDLQDWQQVLIFVDGKTRATIDSPIIVLHKDNDFTQSLTIETGGVWTLSDVDDEYLQIDAGQMSGVGSAEIEIRKPETFDEPGFHTSTFTLTVDGAVVSEMSIQVYIFIGEGLGPIKQFSIVLSEDNDYLHSLNIQSEGELLPIGVNDALFSVTKQPAGIVVAKSPSLTTDRMCSFALVCFEPAEATIVFVKIIVTVPLKAVYHPPYPAEQVTATHGQTITVNLTAPRYDHQLLYITRDRAWSLEDVEIDKIDAQQTTHDGGGYVTIQKNANLAATETVTTTFRIVSLNQWVNVVVNIIPPITGEWVNPRSGEEGVSGTQDIYIYI